MFKEFKKFISKGNVVDLAVGVIIGGAFGKIVSSLVNDILMPIIGVIIGGVDFSGLVLKIGDAKIAYGMFIQNVIDFIIIAFCVFIFVKIVNKLSDVTNRLEKKEEIKEDKIEEIWEEIKPLIKDCLDMMVAMREVEGNKLKEDILSKISVIEQLVSKVEEFADTIPKAFKVKLEERLKELLGNVDIDENRVAMEVCMLADKATIDEEIIRLRSHINQVRETLNLNEPVGRKLDFIVQEMNRETNTIGSKSSDIQMTNIVIDIKNILEKIREQVQNIE